MDGTMEFFGRVRAALKSTDVVVDLGAGRGAWYYEDKSEARRQLRHIKPIVAKLIGLDIDPIVLTNPTTTENYVIESDRLPLADCCADAVIADYVLEHIQNVEMFFQEIDRILKPGGYFCARTPHKYQYVSTFARIVKNKYHTDVLSRAQPNRKPEDVFPTAYCLNTYGDIKRTFKNYANFSYLYCSEPSYYFGQKQIYECLSVFQRFLPQIFVSNLFIFLKKP